ncbi:MAG: hypothetical protein AAF937_00035 [Planctomycetota bacterium]
MELPTHTICTQSYQAVLYDRALHPELFDLRSRRVHALATAELETWLMPGCHLLRFESGPTCATELLIDREDGLPETGVLSAILCAGEHEFEHSLRGSPVTYMLSVQTESLSENLYAATMREMREHAADNESDTFAWVSDAGENLSLLDVQTFHKEVHVQAYHLIAAGGFVLRSQSLFERK